MSLQYPQNTVWYVEASSANGEDRTSGSAVAVWLQKLGQPGTRRKYLLTCAHVVRGQLPKHGAGCGPWLTDVRVWKPGNGFNPQDFFRAQVTELAGFTPTTERLATSDWVVLDVQNEAFQGTDGNDAVREWNIATHTELSIVGYADGRTRFAEAGNIVKPFARAKFSLTTTQLGVLTYIGDGETREGMSGGGVFAGDHSLRGLHRAKRDPTKSGQAVSVSQIEARLRTLGYERGGDFPPPRPADAPPDTAGASVVPRGLKAFGPEDREFYPSLLPPPYREGLPESIGEWKREIESFDAAETFRIGYLHGPSGCGKSSLICAGLKPRLGPHVTAVYVDATDQGVETGLRRRLVRELQDRGLTELATDVTTAEDLSRALQILLDDSLAGRKFVLIVDQFEQWLHEHRATTGETELGKALRLCDGTRLQALLLVRSEFVLGISRFIGTLQVDWKRDVTSRYFDRFDPEHALSLLARFGAALDRLPFDLSQREAFLRRAVRLLAEDDGRVVAVKLALFTDMLKGARWTVDALPTGFQSLGQEFLRRQFSLPEGNPLLVAHRRGAMALLERLLPEYGRRIRGATRSEEELRAAFDQHHGAENFATILDYLNSQLRLITPAETFDETPPSASTGATAVSNPVKVSGSPSLLRPEAAQPVQRFQLTHDYLVPSVREWLDAELGRTWDGRAIVRLRELATSRETTQDDRFLPRTFEFIRIAAATTWGRHPRTPAEASLLRASCKRHGLRLLLTAIVLAVATVAGLHLLHQHPAWIRGQLSEYAVNVTERDPGQGWMARADGYRDVETNQLGVGMFAQRNMNVVGPLLARLPNLQVIDFDDLATLETVRLNGLRSLTRLELDGCERLIAVHLTDLPALDRLTLSGCQRLEDLKDLPELRGLRHLDLSGCVSLSDPHALLSSLPPGVEMLGLNQWDQFAVNQDRAASVPSGLFGRPIKHLTLARCKAISLSGMSKLPQLERLDLSACESIQDQAELGRCTGLKRLVIQKMPSNDRLRQLMRFEARSIRWLDLSHSNIETLDALPKWGDVRILDLTGCEKLKSLQGIANLSGLTTLHLDECVMLDDLTPLSGLKLHELTLRGCAGLSDLDALADVPTLRRLDLTDCKGVVSLTPLAGLTLEAIDMSGLSLWEPANRTRYLRVLGDSASRVTLRKLAWRGIMSTRDGEVIVDGRGSPSSPQLSVGEFAGFEGLTEIDFGDREDDYTEDPPHLGEFEKLRGLRIAEFNVYGFSDDQRRQVEAVLPGTRLSVQRERISLARQREP